MIKAAIEELESVLLEIEKSPDDMRVAEARNIRAINHFAAEIADEAPLAEVDELVGEVHQRVKHLLENKDSAGSHNQFKK